jgi:DNA-binding CsgD family transcriptional regulator
LQDALREAAVGAAAERTFRVRPRDGTNDALDEQGTLGFLRSDGSPMPPTELPGPAALRTGTAVIDAIVGVVTTHASVRWLCVNATPIVGPDGTTPVGVVAVGVDITRRHERDQSRATGDDAPVSLTAREHQVLQLLAEGCSSRQIAEQLRVSLNTARNYTQRLFRKLDAHSRLEAVAVAIRAGLVKRTPA